MADSPPENIVLQLLRDMRSGIGEMRKKIATKDDTAEIRSELHSLRADVASDIHALDAKIDASRQDLSDKIAGLRRAVVEYHSSAIGHGVLFTEIEDRVRRIEQRLDMERHS
jgi:hypothetical protein